MLAFAHIYSDLYTKTTSKKSFLILVLEIATIVLNLPRTVYKEGGRAKQRAYPRLGSFSYANPAGACLIATLVGGAAEGLPLISPPWRPYTASLGDLIIGILLAPIVPHGRQAMFTLVSASPMGDENPAACSPSRLGTEALLAFGLAGKFPVFVDGWLIATVLRRLLGARRYR